jgi:hypothetical protein
MADNSVGDSIKTRLPKVGKTENKYEDTFKRYEYPDGSVAYHVTTPGNRHEVKFHSSGAYTITTESGDSINVTPGHGVSYSRSGTTTTVDHNMDHKCGGHCRDQGGKGEHYTVMTGDQSSVTGGDRAEVILGNMGIAAKGRMYLGTGSTLAMRADGGLELRTDGDMNIIAKTISMNGSRMFG